MLSFRNRYLFSSLILVLVFTTAYYLYSPRIFQQRLKQPTVPPEPTPDHPPEKAPDPYPKYKPAGPYNFEPIIDNFPLLSHANSPSFLPPIPSWNKPPQPHVPEPTPLLIGFTRNWRLLQQVVVSYITAGWPPEDIWVVENTGVMDSNKNGKLSLQNPFFVNYTRMEKLLGVNVIRTPTLLSFAQLQNFFLSVAVERKWETYFWSHMDAVAVSYEAKYAEEHPESVFHDIKHSDFKSLYTNCVHHLREAKALRPPNDRWALRFFHYDHLSLVNVRAYLDIGGWDTMIPYYTTDCDMHSRIQMKGWSIKDVDAGIVSDVASSLDDLIVLYRKNGTVKPSFTEMDKLEEELAANSTSSTTDQESPEETKPEKRILPDVGADSRAAADSPQTWEEDTIASESYHQLIRTLNSMEVSKAQSKKGRNTWQTRQRGGEGEPFYRDPQGFEDSLQMTIDFGKSVFAEKWGHRDCDILDKGLKAEDAWRVEHDW